MTKKELQARLDAIVFVIEGISTQLIAKRPHREIQNWLSAQAMLVAAGRQDELKPWKKLKEEWIEEPSTTMEFKGGEE